MQHMKKVTINFGKEKKQATIAIIGFGRFGKLLAQIFLENSNARVFVVSKKKQPKTHPNLFFVKLNEIISADIVIPCVPISEFKKVILQIAPLLTNVAVVMDVCSIKVLPARIMKKHLPKNIQIIASHPMFGPDAFRLNQGLKNLKLVLHNVRADQPVYSKIKSFFKQLELKVIELSPQKHDQFLAWRLGYSYLIGKIGQQLKLKETPIDTLDFKLLLQNMKIVSSDSEQLFLDMQINNPFAKEVHHKFKKVSEEIFDKIK